MKKGRMLKSATSTAGAVVGKGCAGAIYGSIQVWVSQVNLAVPDWWLKFCTQSKFSSSRHFPRCEVPNFPLARHTSNVNVDKSLFFSNFPEQLVSEKGSSQFCQWIDRQSGLFNCQNKICTFFFGTKTSWDSVRCEQSDIYWGVLLTKCPEDYQQRMIFAVSKDVPVCETAKGTDRSSCGWDWGKVLC